MRRLTKNALIAGLGISAIAALTTSASAKDSTWTVTPGGNTTATSTGFVYAVDDQTTQEIDCDSANSTVTLQSGSGLSGTGIASVTSFTFVNCVAPANLPYRITVNGLPLSVDATGYDSAAGTTTTTPSVTHAERRALQDAQSHQEYRRRRYWPVRHRGTYHLRLSQRLHLDCEPGGQCHRRVLRLRIGGGHQYHPRNRL